MDGDHIMQHISDREKNIRIKHYFYTSILNFKALLVRSRAYCVLVIRGPNEHKLFLFSLDMRWVSCNFR